MWLAVGLVAPAARAAAAAGAGIFSVAGAGATPAAAAGAASGPLDSPPASSTATLGTYDFETGESTPFVWHGKLLMMESISFCFPNHLRVWQPELYGGAKCPSYIRIRDMATGVVVSNMTSSCNHTFGAAYVEPSAAAGGAGTLHIFTSRCARFMASQNFCEDSVDRADAVCPCWHGKGPGSEVKNCAVDVFSSTDPALIASSFTKAAEPFFPEKAVANVDVTWVPHGASPPGIVPMINYVMVLEEGDLVGTSSVEPTSGWRYLQGARANATGPHLGCPTIRYSESDRHFYVLSGGKGVQIMRSRDLVHWEMGATAMTCGGAQAPVDRRTITRDGIFKWHLRDDPTVRNFTTFLPAGSWDKFASDLDVTEWDNRTLVAFICGDQRTSGMAMLAEYNGPLDQWLASHFVPPSVNLVLKSDDRGIAIGSNRLVPLPSAMTKGSSTLPLAAAFCIQQASSPHAVLTAAIARIEGIIFMHGGQSGAIGLQTLKLNVTESFDLPQLGGNESYTLQIDASTATLTAPTINGALHGLQTFSQLCRYDFDKDAVVIDEAPWQISDAPRFSHRGLMLDTARHFYPPAAILPLLDAMAAVKLSVFHWHIVDDTSFPLVIPGTNLSAGAYHPSQRYSRMDVETVVKAATERGIRVIPEFDLPAHTAPAWCVGEPEICTASGTAIDPSSPRLYEVINKVIKHAADLFPDEYIHLGGDEVALSVWTSDAKVAAYLRKQHPGLSLKKAAEAEAYGSFMGKLHTIAAKYQKKIIHWEDVFDWAGPVESCGGVTPTLSNDTIVQVFRGGFGSGPKPCKDQALGGCVCGSNGAATTKAAAAAGYQTIWDPPASWYLSCYSDKCGTSGGGAGFEGWERVFAAEPFLCEKASAAGCGTRGADVSITDPDTRERVIGGEVTVWSERLDPAIMLATAFPRAAAAAERLWSPRAKDIGAETAAARPRMEALQCLMLDRGLGVSTLAGGNEASNFSLPSRPSGPGPNC